MLIQILDYTVDEVLEIDTDDLVGVIPCQDEERIYLVNYDGIAYEVPRKVWECFGISLEDPYTELGKEIATRTGEDLDDLEEIINNFYEYGFLNDDEYRDLNDRL